MSADVTTTPFHTIDSFAVKTNLYKTFGFIESQISLKQIFIFIETNIQIN